MMTIATTSVERIWIALDAGGYQPESQRAGQFKALCPVHGDTHPSLSVTYVPARERTLLHCHTCKADAAEILAEVHLTLQDAYDKPLEHSRGRVARTPRPRRCPAPRRIAVRPTVELPRTGWTTTATYDYTTSEGTVIERVQRREVVVDGARHKKFAQEFRQPGSRFAWKKTPGFVPVFYRQAAVDQALKDGKPVWILEGEKDVENAVAAGIAAATTNAQGAAQFPATLIKQLRGSVIIVADRDLAGYTRARDLKAALIERDVDVTVLLPATLEHKSDLTDHLEAGYSINDLIQPTDRDLDALILAAATCKILTSRIRRDLDEIDAHQALAVREGDADGLHRAAARHWAGQVLQTWETHRTEHLTGFVAGGDLTAEGRRAAHCIGRAIASATQTTTNLRTAGLIR
ncbi:hypothetical protein ACPPVW_18490 [Leifsonia sp. McL0607]|uniref:hypothetical protein n=1 Tax=Leifsonia sp. McL0607 TaxID=3415672 RepID=UPI003CFB13FF